MAKKRHQDHKGFPQGWRWKNGAYRYRVPKGKEAQWDNKTEFRLGRSLPEAYSTYAGKIASYDGAIQTFGQLFDRYLLDVIPNKSMRTQKEDIKTVSKLREWIGSNLVGNFQPVHAYQLRDHIKQQSVKGSGEKYANRCMALLKHCLSKAIEWGVVAEHPMTESKFKMFPEAKSQLRIPTFDEIEEALKLANPTLKAFVRLSCLTGLRVTDILDIKQSDITKEKMTVRIGKTAKTVGKTMEYEMTQDLAKVIAEAKAIKPLSIYLFHNRKGQSYLKEDKTFEGVSSMWGRWMSKFPKEQRFSIRSLRNLVGHQDDLATASERLGHASQTTTQKFYRSNTSKVVPLKFSQ